MKNFSRHNINVYSFVNEVNGRCVYVIKSTKHLICRCYFNNERSATVADSHSQRHSKRSIVRYLKLRYLLINIVSEKVHLAILVFNKF